MLNVPVPCNHVDPGSSANSKMRAADISPDEKEHWQDRQRAMQRQM
jgi:hypothetical protein